MTTTKYSFDRATLVKAGGDLDRVGTTFKTNDGRLFVKDVRVEASAWLEMIRKKRILEILSDNNLIPKATFNTENCQGLSGSIVCESSPWIVHPSTYSLLAFRDAALTWIQINEMLYSIDSDLGLIDAHYGNFALFEQSKPKWIDMGSIQALSSELQGIDQFIRYFVYPLIVFDRIPGKRWIVQNRIRHPKGGVTVDEFKELIDSDFDISVNANMGRINALAKLKAMIEEVEFRQNTNFWSSYRPPQAIDDVLNGNYKSGSDIRPQTVENILTAISANTMIDIGANDGLYSLMGAKAGKMVLAIDTDDFSLNKLYTLLPKCPELNITVSAQSFMNVEQRADLVLALGLTHHLVLSQKLTFDAVANKLSDMSSKHALTEFMPAGLGGTRTHPEIQPNPLPFNYTLEAYIGALSKFFKTIAVLNYGRKVEFSQRVMIMCLNKY